jgi:biotin carboxyl carrier protein
MKQTYTYQNKPFSIDLAQSGKVYTVIFGGRTFSVELIRVDGERLDLSIDVVATSAYISKDGVKRWVTVNGQTLVLTNSNEARKSAGHSSHPANELVAQMPGLVRAVTVSENDLVIKGQTLAVIEAMKMENKVTAPFDGQVKKLLIRVGQTVEREQFLLELTRIEPAMNNEEPDSNPA